MALVSGELVARARRGDPRLAVLPDVEVLCQALAGARRIVIGGEAYVVETRLREIGARYLPITREWALEAAAPDAIRSLCELVAGRLLTLEWR